MTRTYLKLAILIAVFVSMISCSRNLAVSDYVAPIEIQNGNAWKNNPYKLNVIYFVPNDVDSIPTFEKRLSKILLDAQLFIADNMDREGFGRKSFGLDLVNDSLINIHYITGKFDKEKYRYGSPGVSALKAEVNEYFATNPEYKKSEHHLVIVPTFDTADKNKPGGPPFVGSGTFCFALDFANLDAKNLGIGGVVGDAATKWIGGLVHELGHGLNASHNIMIKSLAPSLGTALMGSGNSTYGKSTTSLTKVTAATFNNSQVFSTVPRSDWYANARAEITSLYSSFQDNNIIISGKFVTDVKVEDVVIWHDRTPYGTNNDYDAVSWATKIIGQDSFRFVCPLSDFYNLDSEYQLRIGFMHVNGSRTTASYLYTFNNKIPDLSKVVQHVLLPVTDWKVLSASSVQGNSVGANILDRNASTTWHTKYSPKEDVHPHEFIVDMGAVRTVRGVAFKNRSNLNGALKNIEIYSSNDNVSWELIKATQLDKLSGSWINVDLDNHLNVRYLKVKSINSWGDFNYTHLDEFGAY